MSHTSCIIWDESNLCPVPRSALPWLPASDKILILISNTCFRFFAAHTNLNLSVQRPSYTGQDQVINGRRSQSHCVRLSQYLFRTQKLTPSISPSRFLISIMQLWEFFGQAFWVWTMFSAKYLANVFSEQYRKLNITNRMHTFHTIFIHPDSFAMSHIWCVTMKAAYNTFRTWGGQHNRFRWWRYCWTCRWSLWLSWWHRCWWFRRFRFFRRSFTFRFCCRWIWRCCWIVNIISFLAIKPLFRVHWFLEAYIKNFVILKKIVKRLQI